MKTKLIKEFEDKHQRSRFLQDTGIGDMHSEQGCYCDEYVEFLEQKLANGVGQSDSNCNLQNVMDSQFEAYAAFCIELDRQGMKPIKYKDYLEIG